MSLIKRLKTILPQCAPEQVYTAESKEQIINVIKELNTKDNDTLLEAYNEISQLMAKRIIKKPEKELIHKKITNVIETISTIKTEIVKTTQIITTNTEDNIAEKIGKLENELDSKIEHYNKFTKNNPMTGITWDKTRKKYRLYYDKLNKYNSDLSILTKELTDLICAKNGKNISNICAINFIEYKATNIIIYDNIKSPLFDINHIINILDFSAPRKKYEQFKDKITNYYFKKNEYGGYIIKELINEETMYQIVLSSNSKFSKSFKQDVSKILVKLRETNQLEITNGNLILKPTFNNKKELNDKNIETQLTKYIKPNNEIIQTYNNPYYVEFLKSLIKDGQDIIINKYVGQHIIYMFIITLIDKENYNRIFCKIGYTADILERIKSLKDEYACGFFLINLKRIKKEQAEKDFHRSIKLAHSNLSYIINVNKKDKDEIYIFDEVIVKEFNAIEEESLPRNQSEEKIDIFIGNLIKNQYNTFMAFLAKQNELVFYNFLNESKTITNDQLKSIIEFHNINNNSYKIQMDYAEREKERIFELEKFKNTAELTKLEIRKLELQVQLSLIEKNKKE